MKFLKAFVIALMSLLLTGCYTQLQYSQSMKKITDQEKKNNTPAYSWSGEEKAESSEEMKNEEEVEDYIPVYYKDYEYTTKYGNVYNFYGNDWYGNNYRPYTRYGSYNSWHPYLYDRWAYHSFYGRGYDYPHYGFSISLSWGWPQYHYGFYDPFYNSYYDYYWHRYYNRYAYSYWNFYGKSGYGQGYYPDKKVREDRNVRYGPRSIGTNRVATDSNRSRTVERDRSAVVTNKTSSTVRTRSTGTTRTRGTVRSTRVNRSKSNDSSTVRSRSRGNIRVDDKNVSEHNYRSRGYTSDLPLVIDEKQLERIRARNSGNRNSIIHRSQSNSNREKTKLFNRMKNFFKHNSGSFSIENNGRTFRIRSSSPSTNRSAVNRSSSSNNRRSVTRSKSSSSNSRSRGSSSSSSRSRSGGSSSDSDSDHSRGN